MADLANRLEGAAADVEAARTAAINARQSPPSTTPADAAAARLLGVNPSELLDVADGPNGIVITTTDGVRYIVVPAEHPDGEGKTGVMILDDHLDDHHLAAGLQEHPGFPGYVTDRDGYLRRRDETARALKTKTVDGITSSSAGFPVFVPASWQ